MTLDTEFDLAVQHFWHTRATETVTGGKHLDAFAALLTKKIVEVGVDAAEVFTRKDRIIPGFFRATKDWDLLVVRKKRLLAVIEMKSQVGSFGNNVNNRAEEALGSAFDLQRAQIHGAFGDTLAPWLGYVFILEERDGPKGSTNQVRVRSPHFAVQPAFKEASYVQRVGELCRRLVSEKVYDASWFMLTRPVPSYRHPDPQLSGDVFITALQGHLKAQLAAETA